VLLDFGGSGREIVRQPLQQIGIDEDALHLHRRQHAHHRTLQRFINSPLADLRETRLQQQPQPQSDVGILGCILRRAIDRHLIEADHRFSGASNVLERNALVVQVTQGKFIHAVTDIARFQHVGHQHGVIERSHVDVVALQHLDIIFEILADLQDRGIFQQGL